MKKIFCILIIVLIISDLHGTTPNRFLNDEWFVEVKDKDSISQIKNEIGFLHSLKIDENLKLVLNDKWELIYRVSNASRTYIGGAIDRTIRSENYYIANNQIAETLTSREMLIYFNIIDNSSGPNFFPNHRWQIRMLSSEYLFLTNGDFYFGSETNWRTQTSYYFRKVNE